MCQDLYGNAVAGAFISALSRLLTYYLQMQGFTCGYDDLLLVKKAEQARSALLDTAETAALAASARFVGEEVPQLMQGADGSKPKPQSAIAVGVCLSLLRLLSALSHHGLLHVCQCIRSARSFTKKNKLKHADEQNSQVCTTTKGSLQAGVRTHHYARYRVGIAREKCESGGEVLLRRVYGNESVMVRRRRRCGRERAGPSSARWRSGTAPARRLARGMMRLQRPHCTRWAAMSSKFACPTASASPSRSTASPS